MLTGIGATLHEGRYFVHQLATGMPERFYIGDVAGLAGDLTTPEWDAAGQGHGFRGFEVDHVLELQLGGTNTPENLELLDRRINGASGLFIMKSIEGKVQDYLAAVPDSDRNDPALKLADWRANWNLTFEKAVAPKKDPPPEPGGNDRWTREQIKQGKHLDQKGVLAEADPDKLGSKSEVKLFPSATGGVVTTLRPSGGADGVKFFKPFKATAAEYFVEDTSGPQLATFSFALDGTKGLKLDETPTVDAKRLPGMKFAGSVDRTAARRSLAKLGAVKLSPVELDTVDLGPNGIYAEGRIVTSLPIVAGTAIDLVLDGPELTVSHTFQMGDFKLPPPLKATQSTLAVSASTDGDITAAGRVDAQIDKLGKGFLAVDAGTTAGLSLSGGFDFTSEIFQQAHVGLSYHDGKYSGDGTLAIAGGKVAGIKSGSLHASYLEDHFEATGQAVFDLPGIDSADVHLAYDEASGMTLTASPQLKQMPGIKSGSLTVAVQQPPGGGAVKLSGHGTAEPDIAGIDAQLTVDYDDGAFLAQAQAPFKAGLIDGTLTAGATNQPLGADGLPAPAPGGAGGELRMFGAGSATVKLTDSLTGTAAIRLLANGEVEASGQLTVQSNLWEGRHLVNRDLVPRIAADVPIFPPVVLHLGAGLKLRVGYGPGVLSGSVGITYNPSHEDQAKLDGALHLHASAYAGLELYTEIGLGLGVTGASISGNIEPWWGTASPGQPRCRTARQLDAGRRCRDRQQPRNDAAAGARLRPRRQRGRDARTAQRRAVARTSRQRLLELGAELRSRLADPLRVAQAVRAERRRHQSQSSRSRAGGRRPADPPAEGTGMTVSSQPAVPEQVRAQWRAAAAADPPDPSALSNLGILAASDGDLAKGRELLERALAADPEHGRAWSNLAAVLGAQNDLAGARAAYARAAEADPHDPAPLHARGRLALAQHDFPAAETAFRGALSRAPGHPAMLTGLGAAVAARGRLEEGLELLEHAARLDPGLAAAWEQIGVVRMRRGDLGLARDALRRALAVEPERLSARRVLALVHVARGEHGQAARQLDAILALHPGEPTAAVDRAALELAADERDAALGRLDAVLAAHPDDERAAEMRAVALEGAGGDE